MKKTVLFFMVLALLGTMLVTGLARAQWQPYKPEVQECLPAKPVLDPISTIKDVLSTTSINYRLCLEYGESLWQEDWRYQALFF